VLYFLSPYYIWGYLCLTLSGSGVLEILKGFNLNNPRCYLGKDAIWGMPEEY